MGVRERLPGEMETYRQVKWAFAGLFVVGLLIFPYTGVTVTWLDFAMTILIFSLAAVAFNVLLGYTGLLSFGHAAFFGGAAYAVTLAMDLWSVQEFFVLLGIGVLTAFLLSVVIGWISVRHSGAYYALLMLALAQLLYVLAFQMRSYTGGEGGTHVSQPTIVGVDFYEQLGYLEYLQGIYYYLVVFIVVVSALALWVLMRSSFGLTLRAVRDSPDRAASVGIPVRRYRWYATMVSGTFTGIAGVLFAFKAGHVSPDSTLFWMLSGEIAIMAILGGTSMFLGPAVGAFTFLFIERYSTGLVAGYWMLLVGVILLGVVLFLPQGILVGLRQATERVQAMRRGSSRWSSFDTEREEETE